MLRPAWLLPPCPHCCEPPWLGSPTGEGTAGTQPVPLSQAENLLPQVPADIYLETNAGQENPACLLHCCRPKSHLSSSLLWKGEESQGSWEELQPAAGSSRDGACCDPDPAIPVLLTRQTWQGAASPVPKALVWALCRAARQRSHPASCPSCPSCTCVHVLSLASPGPIAGQLQRAPGANSNRNENTKVWRIGQENQLP